MKKLIPYTLIGITGLLLIFFYNFYKTRVENIKSDIFEEKSIFLKNTVPNLIKQKRENTSTITYILSQDRKLISYLKDEKHTASIDYSNIIQWIHKKGEYKNLWINIIDSNGINLYRSWTDRHGDDLKPHRPDIVKMLKNPKQHSLISTGKYDMTFRTMTPVFDHGEFLGIIEMISHFNSITQRLENKHILSLLLVEPAYAKNILYPFSKRFLSHYYLANLNAPPKLAKLVENYGVKKLLGIKNYTLFNGYLLTDYTIPDISGKTMAHLLLFYPLNQIDMHKVDEFTIRFLIFTIISLLIFILLILLLLNRRYIKTLNKEVESKTRAIKTNSEELSSLVKTYDKAVIFSQTDMQGTITAVSEAFCDISGYSKKELIGANHNIVRHPDMPKTRFAYLWQEIQQEHWVKMEIKNRKKDGTYYWVNAEIGPHYDIEGRHIGYSAVRQDITAIKDLEQIQKEVIIVLGSIGESHSIETGEHVKRVGAFARFLAEKYGLSHEEVENIEMAVPMHDIGKISIPDKILNKPTSLNKEEWEIMKTHTTEGYKLLSVSSRPLLKMAATIALEHHEKYDGSGYPYGLKGEKISIYGRITALADVFDALNHKRIYKDAWSKEAVLSYFKKERGKAFDPVLIDILLKNIDSFYEIKNRYKNHST